MCVFRNVSLCAPGQACELHVSTETGLLDVPQRASGYGFKSVSKQPTFLSLTPPPQLLVHYREKLGEGGIRIDNMEMEVLALLHLPVHSQSHAR